MLCYTIAVSQQETRPSSPPTSASHHLRTVRHGGPTVYEEGSRQSFYEGKWAEPDYSDGSLRNWLVRKQRFFLHRLSRSKSARVLDLGCGAGWKVFTRAGQVVGIDLSRESVAGARAIYYAVTAGSLTHFPFKDASFDLVVSSDVLGHIPLEHKQEALQEIYRVLKPGGRTLHYIESEGDDPLTRYARQDPVLYQRYILGPEGHEGLESPGASFRRFREAGFQPVREIPAYRMLMYLGRLPQLYDNEYAERSAPLRLAVALSKLLTRWAPLEIASNLCMAFLLELTDRVFPESWGNGVMVEYVK